MMTTAALLMRLTAFAFVALARCEVQRLDASTIDAAINDASKATFVAFVAPWWGHCRCL